MKGVNEKRGGMKGGVERKEGRDERRGEMKAREE